MVMSMTGYGRASKNYKEKAITIEIRSLNGKATDLRFKLPTHYKEKELDLRRIIIDKAHRGKIDASISTDSESGVSEFGLNRALFKKYYRELIDLQQELGIGDADIMQSILRIPNVVQTVAEDLSEEECNCLISVTKEALEALTAYRINEGRAMDADLRLRVNNIRQLQTEVPPLEKVRIDALKIRMKKNLDEYLGRDKVDKNRFEQEVLHYLEKIDINEEKVRLEQHCIYFVEELNKPEMQKGRKLSFIAQEIGREINTMGAKAQNSDLQKIVVRMKDELEKIKEQLANIV